MRDLFSFVGRFFDNLSFQKRSGILFLFGACGFYLMFPNGELWPMVMVFTAASGSSLMCSARPAEPVELEPPTNSN